MERTWSSWSQNPWKANIGSISVGDKVIVDAGTVAAASAVADAAAAVVPVEREKRYLLFQRNTTDPRQLSLDFEAFVPTSATHFPAPNNKIRITKPPTLFNERVSQRASEHASASQPSSQPTGRPTTERTNERTWSNISYYRLSHHEPLRKRTEIMKDKLCHERQTNLSEGTAQRL